jgi:hypothetical protein
MNAKMLVVAQRIQEKMNENEPFREEMAMKLEVEGEEGEETTIIDAFQDVLERCDEESFKPKECKAAKELAVQLGIAKHVTEEELTHIQTTGRKKYWFLHEGRKYDFSKHLEELGYG